jgi:ferredoxin-nitrite reductase
MRGLVSCTGMDYCHFALIETKVGRSKRADSEQNSARPTLAHTLVGCPAGCGNHTAAEIGLLGKNIKLNGEISEAVDVFAGAPRGVSQIFQSSSWKTCRARI